MKTILKNRYFWIAIVLGLVIGDLIGVMVFKRDTTADSKDIKSPLVATTTSPFLVRVATQVAGDTVFVSEARMVASSTWLAVREENGGLLGRILGARRVDATASSDLTIDLLRPTVPHVMYAVVMYEDDGDREFDHLKDTLVEEDGSPLVYPFAVSGK